MMGTPCDWIGMPSGYTFPVEIDALASFTTSGVSRFSAPRSSSSPHRPQLFSAMPETLVFRSLL